MDSALHLTTRQSELLAELRTMETPDAWLLFVNAGFEMADAKALFDLGLIETSRQMGMPAARINTWVDHGGGGCPVDSEQHVSVRWAKDADTTTHRAGTLNWSAVTAYRVETDTGANT